MFFENDNKRGLWSLHNKVINVEKLSLWKIKKPGNFMYQEGFLVKLDAFEIYL